MLAAEEKSAETSITAFLKDIDTEDFEPLDREEERRLVRRMNEEGVEWTTLTWEDPVNPELAERVEKLERQNRWIKGRACIGRRDSGAGRLPSPGGRYGGNSTVHPSGLGRP